ncbi:hypothetical protein QJS10_CPB19g00548 [Acorus calamus]|uniref:Uncharacterized protein n=1 Tax=Acorus calamus TaxID=4465 RepID=A0AAV9CHR9_ACOCL|nr:hypothetical protein QJS10_CPB19g00548 [Acorus calamus]
MALHRRTHPLLEASSLHPHRSLYRAAHIKVWKDFQVPVTRKASDLLKVINETLRLGNVVRYLPRKNFIQDMKSLVDIL